MSSDKITFPKLKGQSDFKIWRLRTEALLVRENTTSAIIAENLPVNLEIDRKALSTIKLLVEDGPLLQIQYSVTAKEAWQTLEDLYSPKGFTSEFLLYKEFFSTTLQSLNSIEEYINKIKQLSN